MVPGKLIGRWRGLFAKSAAMSAPLLLAACLATGSQDRAYRDTSVPLSVTTRGTTQDMAGPWFVRAHTPGEGGIAMVTLIPDKDGSPAVELFREACLLSGDCETEAELWRAAPLGQNRWRLTRERQTRELWVVWVDDGFRTAAIGTPDGSYGWILDRKPAGGADRITAASQILEFNGYQTSAFKSR